jgi:hypothetical protein
LYAVFIKILLSFSATRATPLLMGGASEITSNIFIIVDQQSVDCPFTNLRELIVTMNTSFQRVG